MFHEISGLKDLYLSPLTCIKKALMAFPLLSLPFIPVLFCIRSGVIYLQILGLFLGAKLSFAFFDMLLNFENPISAVKKSFISTKGYTLQLIYSIILVCLPANIFEFISTGLILNFVMASEFTPGFGIYLLFRIVDICFVLMCSSLLIVLFRIYCLFTETSNKTLVQ